MRLQQIVSKVEVWLRQVLSACDAQLALARKEMAAVQAGPDADAHLAGMEERLTGSLNDILHDAEAILEPLRNDVAVFFETVDDPTPQEQDAADRLDGVTEDVRDWLLRKVASLVAQARARELAPGAPEATSMQPVAMAPRDAPQPAAAAPSVVRPLVPSLPTQLGYGDPDDIRESYGPPLAAPIAQPASPAAREGGSVPLPQREPQSAAIAPTIRRFCTECGAPLGPDAAPPARCPSCGRQP